MRDEYNMLLNSLKNMETCSKNEFKNITNIFYSLKESVMKDINFSKEKITQEVLQGNESSIQTFNNFFVENTNKNKLFFDTLIQLNTKLEKYQEGLILSKEYEQMVKDLEMEICTLKQQINENMSLIGIKDAQIEEKLFLQEEQALKLATYKDEKEKLTETVNATNIKLDNYEQEILYFQNLLNTEKANFENKFTTQNEINIAIMSENKTLKQKVGELQDYKTTLAEEQKNKLDKFQKINDQFQKLNVETIQLKAHELELEEENKNLKKSIESNKESFQEKVKELKLLRQSKILLNTQKQDFIAEKISLQDKNEEYQLIIKQLRTEVTGLKEKLKKLEQHNFKKEADSVEDIPKANTASYHKERSNSIFLQTQVLRDPIKKTVTQQNKNNNKRKMVSRNIFEKRSESETNEKKKTIDDDFELSLSSNDNLELINSSNVKPIYPKIKMPHRRENKKKLLLVEDCDIDGPKPKKATLNKKKKK